MQGQPPAVARFLEFGSRSGCVSYPTYFCRAVLSKTEQPNLQLLLQKKWEETPQAGFRFAQQAPPLRIFILCPSCPPTRFATGKPGRSRRWRVGWHIGSRSGCVSYPTHFFVGQSHQRLDSPTYNWQRLTKTRRNKMQGQPPAVAQMIRAGSGSRSGCVSYPTYFFVGQ